ncbi:MAG: hypothetical protein AAGI07_12095 [Bacteroidota bacterium]
MKKYEIVAVMLLCALPLLLSHQQKLNGPVLAKMQSGEYQQMHHEFAQEVTKPMAGPFYYGLDLAYIAPVERLRNEDGSINNDIVAPDYNFYSTLAALSYQVGVIKPDAVLVPYKNSQRGADFIASTNNRINPEPKASFAHRFYVRFYFQYAQFRMRQFWGQDCPTRGRRPCDPEFYLNLMKPHLVFEAYGSPFDDRAFENQDANF